MSHSVGYYTKEVEEHQVIGRLHTVLIAQKEVYDAAHRSQYHIGVETEIMRWPVWSSWIGDAESILGPGAVEEWGVVLEVNDTRAKY